ncbi:MAG: DNA polymerase I [Verrucomicrobia bacterium]|nr:DNA polymerase I [Verrucomicrobiota bacterium]
MSSEKRLFLLDGMPLLYRGHFIFMRNPRITSTGMNVSALYGFTNSLLQIIESEKPTHLAVVFDTPEPTFRHQEYPDYKAQREAMPEDIAAAIPLSKQITEAFNVKLITCPGFEADDIIGTLAAQAEQQGFTTFLVTPDKDFAQLVGPHTKLYRPAKAGGGPEIYGVDEVLERWSIQRVDQIIDLLGMAGDAVDNIPGIPGVGEKTAVKLLQQFGDLENLLANTDQLKGKQKEKVEAFADQARLSRRLATIHCEVPLDWSPEDLTIGEPDQDALRELFRQYEFQSLGKRILGGDFKLVSDSPPAQGELLLGGESAPTAPGAAGDATPESLTSAAHVAHQYHLVTDAADLESLVKSLRASTSFCFDTETTGLDARTTGLVGLAFAIVPHEAYYVPAPSGREAARKLLESFRPAFEDPAIEKVGHNLKFDAAVLYAHGVALNGPLFDTMLAHYVIDPEQRHGMDHLSRTFLRYSPIPITSLIGEKERGKEQASIADAPVEAVAEYAAEDADVTLQLRAVLEPLVKTSGAERALNECENPLIPVLVAMEAEGIRLNSEALAEYSIVLGTEIEGLQAAIYEEAGTQFNIASPKQLGEIMFDYMKIEDKGKKTRTGQYQTNEAVLTQLAVKHRIAELVLEYRACQKLKSTYVDALPLAVSPETGRLHTSYNQAVTATGRMQSQNPNLQNIPIRTERGREIRKAFVPRDADHVLLSADYSQIELRIMAELSGDEALLQTFIDGHDVHTATAARVNGVALADVTREMRGQAKMVNFGIIYGISAFGLSQRLRIPRNDAADIISAYFSQYPQVKRFMDQTIESARETGLVQTLLGRRRLLADINSRNATVRQQAERNAINTPIQGTAADLIKIAMVNIHRQFQEKKLQSRMLLQVHDELVFDCKRDEEAAVRECVTACMKHAIKTRVPIVVDIGVGDNWLEAH